MQTRPECDEIAKANAELDRRQDSLAGEIVDLQNLLNSLYPNDLQRPDLEKKIEQMTQQREGLMSELRKGEEALRNCQQGAAPLE